MSSILIIMLTLLSWRVMPYPTQPGQVGGHEGVGVVHKLGLGAEKSNIKVGDRVGIKVNDSLTGDKHIKLLTIFSGSLQLAVHAQLATKGQMVSVL